MANHMVNKKQQTVCWHVDDLKLSHADASANDDFIEALKSEYESIFEDGSGKMKVSRGKIHKYLGMTLDYSIKGQCKITMLDYIEETLQMFEKVAPKDSGTKSSAAPKDLFITNDKCNKLEPNMKETFHSLVAKIPV